MKPFLWIAILICVAIAIVSGIGFSQGSLELFPTAVQQESARLSYGMVFLVASLVAIALLLRVRGLARRAPSKSNGAKII